MSQEQQVQATEGASTKVDAPKVSDAQIAVMDKVFRRLYRGTGSTVIAFGSDYAFNNAIGRNDREEAHKLLDVFMDNLAQKRAEYQARIANPAPATSEPSA